MHSGHKGCSISIDVEFQLLNEESEEAQFSKLISQLQSTTHSCKIMPGPFFSKYRRAFSGRCFGKAKSQQPLT